MNEEERAERFARELDRFLFGGEQAPEDLDDDDLTSLLDVATRRLDNAGATRGAAGQYESDVWERLLNKLGDEEDPVPDSDPDTLSSHHMADVIAMRRQIADNALTIAEQHREDVWSRVQERLADEGAKTPVATAPTATSNVIFSSGDPEFDSLVRISLGNSHLPPRDPEMTQRLWDRVGGLPDANELERTLEARWAASAGIPASLAIKALGAAVAIALLVVAIGPLPSTGFADHPFVEALGTLAGATGVVESSEPPPAPTPDGDTVARHSMTIDDARESLGLPLADPAYLPAGLSLDASTFYEAGITSGSGMFALTYVGDGSTLTVYQEAAGGPGLVAPMGQTIGTVAGGSPAVYYEGGWSAEGAELTWLNTGSQSLVFEPGQLRVIIRYTGPRIDPVELLAVANGLG